MEMSSQDPSGPGLQLAQGLAATTCPGGAGKTEGSRKGEAAPWEASALPSHRGGTPSPHPGQHPARMLVTESG